MPDPGMTLLNRLLDWEFESALVNARAAYAQFCREEKMLDEARAIVAAGDDAACTAEHLAVLLTRLDEANAAKKEEQKS